MGVVQQRTSRKYTCLAITYTHVGADLATAAQANQVRAGPELIVGCADSLLEFHAQLTDLRRAAKQRADQLPVLHQS
jgi:hypothetical protein